MIHRHVTIRRPAVVRRTRKKGPTPKTLRPGRRRIATLAALLAATLVGAVLTAAPAQAAVPSGTDWSGSWNHYATNALEVTGTLPG
ncbi:hypothetical protein [Micromonospora sp. KC723]|uniref:hypothetical protein n=1 Tax=Micromonospora sp. KC723 TaxID=2530381 RepID=UPI0010476C4A|nr:hypothetical protein [Micromonospora sp. KC723]TDB76257.1 hypothetical protein E1165_07655 [Micromonospora sp. KC723]